MSQTLRRRPPAVAGSFYPADPAELRRLLAAMFVAAEALGSPEPVPGELRAIVAPHAGYVYSGTTAAVAYRALATKRPDLRRVILLGPTHRVACRGLAHPGADVLETPLGDVRCLPVPAALRETIPERPDVHADEHSLEVHLPFLQTIAPEVEVLPLAVGLAYPTEVAEALTAILAEMPDAAVVVSSDLSHYLPYDEARAVDAETIERVLGLTEAVEGERACGAFPLNGLLQKSIDDGWRPQLLHACNSGDTAGDKRRVVGYASFAFTSEEDR